ncbi:MAG: hypothetical protein H6633_23875 [Anaerolineales bacterium]|nr:hypothetical protein [Anaerolineales bacterium]
MAEDGQVYDTLPYTDFLHQRLAISGLWRSYGFDKKENIQRLSDRVEQSTESKYERVCF